MYNIGQLLTSAEGEYSSYCVNGLFEVTLPFILEAEVRFWRESNINDKGRLTKEGIEFFPYLLRLNLVKEVEYTEVHCGGYCDYDVTEGRY